MAEKHESVVNEKDLLQVIDQQTQQIMNLTNTVSMYKDHYEMSEKALKEFKEENHIEIRENLIKELKEDVDHYFNRAIEAEEKLELYKERQKKAKGKAPNEIIAKLKTDIKELKSNIGILQTAMMDINSLCWLQIEKYEDDDLKSPFRLIVMTNTQAMTWTEVDYGTKD